MSNFKEQRDRLMKEIKEAAAGPEALAKLAYLRTEFDSAIDDYKNSLTILSDTTYQDRKHFLLELIQNADDASFEGDEASLTFTIYDDRIELLYNEKGFDIADVIAITGTGSSTKANKKHLSNSFIGEKGIGFKSVFALASRVEIESPPWHFQLSRESVIIPEVLDAGVLQPGEGTRLAVYFTDQDVIEMIATELKHFVSGRTESFLFLQRLSHFYVDDRRIGRTPHAHGITIHPSNRAGNLISLSTFPENNTRAYAPYHEDIEFSPDLVKKRWERMSNRTEPLKRSVIAAAPLGPVALDRPGQLFCYLPTDVTLPVPIFLQVDGHTKADRERLHDTENNAWNRFLLSCLPEVLERAILQWREHPEVGKQLLSYVPAEHGSDQLSAVFEHLIERLHKSPWIRTFEGSSISWVKPSEALVADDYWCGWFERFPEVREKAELLLGKRFVNPEWVKQKKWNFLARKYSISAITLEQLALLLKSAPLPKEMLHEDEGLKQLYQYLNGKFSSARYIRETIREDILSSPIFPLGYKEFGSLYCDDHQKPYWVSSRSRRLTGLESTANIRVVDSEYTYRMEAGSDAKDVRIAEVERINARNALVRELLKHLEVSELNEESVLTELQIPFLLTMPQNDPATMKQRYDVLFQIFESHRAKRGSDDKYLSNLSNLNDALFRNESGSLLKLRNCVLPQVFQLMEEDRLFQGSTIEPLYIPELFHLPPEVARSSREEERIKKWREDWRNFLIACGVCAGPRFSVKVTRYENYSDFLLRNKEKCHIWMKRISNDFTTNNNIRLEAVELDEVTKGYLLTEGKDVSKVSDQIYKAWLEHAGADAVYDLTTMHYGYGAPVGFCKATYVRQYHRSVLMHDTLWGGVDKKLIPIRTLSGDVVSASQALRLPQTANRGDLQLAAKYVPIALESMVPIEGRYLSKYIESLSIAPIRAEHLNALWSKVSPEQNDEIIKVMIELQRCGVSGAGLQLFDKVENKLRPAHEFRLGKGTKENIPYIELQYGEHGRTLGELLNLKVESQAAVFYEDLYELIKKLQTKVPVENDAVYRLLTDWRKMNASNRREVRLQIQKMLLEFEMKVLPIVVCNHSSLASGLTTNGHWALHIEVPSSEVIEIQEIARDIGFVNPDEIGEIQFFEPAYLDEQEQETSQYLLTEYTCLLEPEEAARFFSLPYGFSDPKSVSERIVRVKKGVRTISEHMEKSIPLPFFHEESNQFMVNGNDSLEELLARIISLSGMTTYRHALRDVRDISRSKRATLPVPANQTNPKEVLNQVKTALYEATRGGDVAADEHNPWKLDMDVEEEQNLRDYLGSTLDENLRSGMIPKEIERRKKQKGKEQKGHKLPEGFAWVDKNGYDPKQFLISEYQGRCQICATQLILSSGRKWIEVFRINETRGEHSWTDRPFNILGLCPNCHCLTKHGGGTDLTPIDNLIMEASVGDTFPIEVQEHFGDFYTTEIKINGKMSSIVFSKTHLAHFIALFTSEQEVVATEE